MAFPSQIELVEAIRQLKSYVELSDEDVNLVSTAALLLNIWAINETNATTYPGDIPQTIYVDAANGYQSVVYSRKYNTLINDFIVTVLTLAGDPYIPVNTPDYILPSSSPNIENKYGLIEVEYEALVNTSQFSIGQQLSKIVIFVNGVPGQPVWVNNSNGLTLTTPPSLPTQAKPTSDYVESLLEFIKLSVDSIDISTNQTKLNTNSLASNLTTLINSTDTIISSLSNLSTTDTTGNLKLDTIITALNSVHTDSTSIDSKLSNLTTVNTTVTQLASKLEDIKTQLVNLQSSLTILNSSTTDNNTTTSSIDTTISSLLSTLTALASSFTFQSGALITDSSAVVQPISVSSLPLPTGAATQSSLALVKTNTDKLDVNLSSIPSTLAKESGGNLEAINTKLPTLTSTVNGLKVDGSAVTQPVSLSSIPLPSGAATAANQLDSITLETTINTNINSINTKLSTGTILVDGSDVTQPISAIALPLPTGAATQITLSSIDTNIANLASVEWSTAAGQDSANNKLQTIINSLPDLASSTLQTDGNNSLISIDGKLSGLALSSKQDSSNTLLTTISNKDFATEASLAAIKDAVLGNVNISESVWTDDSNTFFVRKVAFDDDSNTEVVSFKLFDGVTTYVPSTNPKPASTSLNITQPLTDTQLRATPVSVSGSFYPSVQDVNVSSLPLPTGASTSSLQTVGNTTLSNIKIDLNTISTDVSTISTNTSNIVTNTSAITNTNTKLDNVNTKLDTVNTNLNTVNTSIGIGNSSLSNITSKIPTGLTVTANKLIVDGSSVTQPISGTVNTGLSQPLTDTQLRASAVPVSGTFFQSTQPVSAVSLPLPTGAATETTLNTVNTSTLSVKTSTDNLLTPINNIKTDLDSIVTSNSSINTKIPSGLTVTANKLIVDNSSVTQPVSGTVTVSNFVAPLTDTQLRANPVPVTMMATNTNIETVLLAINSVANVNIINGGSGYTLGSAVTFTGGTAVIAATGSIITSSTGAVIGINITNVGQYTTTPTGFTIANGGTGCTGSIVMGSTVELVTDNLATVRGYISNEGVDSLSFEVSLDGYNWIVTEVLNTSSNLTISTASSSDYPLAFVSNVSGTAKFRVRRTSIVNTVTPRIFFNSSSDIAYVKAQTISSSSNVGLTDTQLRASAVPVSLNTLPALSAGTSSIGSITNTSFASTQSGSWVVTANAGTGTFAVSAATLPLPTNAASSALQITGNTSLSNIDIKTPALGQALSVASTPVVIASDQGVITSCSQTNTYQPNPQGISTFSAPLLLDASGRLETHSAVFTDEGSFRDDFSLSTLLTNLLGTVNFTNNSAIITGVGTAFSLELKAGQYIKKTTDANTALVQIDSIISDTSLVLSNVYTGTTESTTAVYSNWYINVSGTGSSVSAASSLLNILSGTASGGNASVLCAGDYPPFSVAFNCSVSQRIANQTVILGLADIDSLTPNVQATVRFTGTSNTVCSFVTSSTSAAADTQTTVVTLPNGALTSTPNTYKIDVSNNRCSLTINGIVCAVNDLHIPQPYDSLLHLLKINNSAAVTSTTVAIDYYYFENVNRIQVDNDFQAEPQRVALTGKTITGLTSDLQLDNTNFLPVSNADKQKNTYSISFSKVAGVATTATDYLVISGSATKTIKIQKIHYTAYSTTANTLVPVTLLLRSTANAGGTVVARTPIRHDQSSPAATATCNTYTVNPTTPGTLIGSIRGDNMLSIVGTSGSNTIGMNHTRMHDFTTGGQEIVLRGVAQSLALNLNGASVAGISFSVEIQFTEE